MSDISNQSYRDLAIPYFIDVFRIVDEVLKANDAPYYLIGVTATDIQLLKEGIEVMGRNIAAILKKSPRLQQRIMKVLDENTSEPNKSSIGKHWASKYHLDVEYAMKLLNSIKKGINENI